jgi:hypothetical protein
MAVGRNFTELFPLYDVTIHDLAPNSTGVDTPVSGAVGASGQSTYLFVTPNTIPNGTSQLPTGVAAEVLLVEVIAPVVTNGGAVVYPDLQWSPKPDSTPLASPTPANRFIADGSYGGNMFPLKSNTVGFRDAIPIGVSLRKLLNDAKNGKPVADMALRATGWKYNSTFQLTLSSSRGWGAGVTGDTVQTPARIIVWGERYTDQMLAPLAPFWRGDFQRTTLRRYLERQNVPMTLSGRQGGVVSVADIASLSGGYAQKGDTVFRDVRFATPAQAVSGTSRYFLTNSQQAYGVQGNVSTRFSGDLGLPFAPVNGVASNARSALILQKFGVTPGAANLAYVGLDIGDAVVPDPNGWPAGQNVVRIPYGQVQPLRSSSELYYPLPDLEVEIIVFAENAAAFVQANGSGSIATGTVSVAWAGVAVQLGGGMTVSPGPAA